MSLPREYEELLEDESFRAGVSKGSLRTATTILTDMLISLNALEIYYQKPVSKSVVPPELEELRVKVEAVKDLIHTALKSAA